MSQEDVMMTIISQILQLLRTVIHASLSQVQYFSPIIFIAVDKLKDQLVKFYLLEVDPRTQHFYVAARRRHRRHRVCSQVHVKNANIASNLTVKFTVQSNSL